MDREANEMYPTKLSLVKKKFRLPAHIARANCEYMQ